MFKAHTIEGLNDWGKNTASAQLGIEFTGSGETWLEARMPVDERTHQPMGLLHGGASVLLAETLGSVAGNLCVEPGQACVGLEINANHLSSVRSGWVYGRVEPIHVGRSTQVWEIKIRREDQKLVCISRLTLAVIQAP